jgi:transposase
MSKSVGGLGETIIASTNPNQKKEGRRRCKKEALLNGILQVAVNGTAWQKIADCGCSGSSCYRYFQELQRRGKLKLIFNELARSKTDIEEGALDTTTASSFRFKMMTGWDAHHKKTGTKISLFTDKKESPADVGFGKADVHDGNFVDDHIKNRLKFQKVCLN